ncbi:MAG: AAA family ATPase, partial [Candidatus Vogelbacteria bacterium]|nr:AAA family ATPase [Candidatus Vogelbacteria bacterium]
AIRRSRTGIRNPKRPIGSFLFLGTTGVGKTETSKALAEVFFGGEKDLLRLDMSEYQGTDALAKLIGSFGESQAGVLSNLMREHPYGVLLLDEFEKSSKEILNLFLQIFDEGFFSDMSGKKVNVRNLIFIATSNAGADLIWQAIREGQKPEAAKIIDSLVSQGVYKPELLNRFDAVVVFNPLTPENLAQIARLLLAKLAKRLAEQGIELAISDYAVKTVATLGANEVFGARPMIRFIQDNVEQPIADKIIKGEITHGFHVDLLPPETGETNLLKIEAKIL